MHCAARTCLLRMFTRGSLCWRSRTLFALVKKIAPKNLRSDWFGTMCAILGVALGTATVNVVLVLDMNTRAVESSRWSTNPTLPIDTTRTVALSGIAKSGVKVSAQDAKTETH